MYTPILASQIRVIQQFFQRNGIQQQLVPALLGQLDAGLVKVQVEAGRSSCFVGELLAHGPLPNSVFARLWPSLAALDLA